MTSNLTSNTTTSDQLPRPDWLSEQQWPFAIRRHRHLRDDGLVTDIHYTDEGTGPTLVFVHAGMWSFIWRDTIAELSSDFRCLTIDFPGAGLSDGEPDQVDIEKFPAIVDAILQQAGVDRATFVIHDLGGVVGVLAAGLHPERVAGLAATNSFAWAPEGRALRTMLGVMGSGPATAILGTLRIIPRMSSTRFGVGRHFDRVDRQAFLGPYRSRTASRNFHRLMGSAAKATAAFAQAERVLAGPLADVPVLTIFGENNDQFGFADRWQGLFPTATRWEVESGNHFPMCDDPAGYADRLRRWHRDEVATDLIRR